MVEQGIEYNPTITFYIIKGHRAMYTTFLSGFIL